MLSPYLLPFLTFCVAIISGIMVYVSRQIRNRRYRSFETRNPRLSESEASEKRVDEFQMWNKITSFFKIATIVYCVFGILYLGWVVLIVH